MYMISKIERALYPANFSTIRAAYIARARLESGRITNARQMMRDSGFEQVDVSDDALLTSDGREILRAFGRAWALLPEIHAKRREEAIAAGQRHAEAKRAAQQPQGQQTTCMALIDGQLCGGTLAMAPVCPRCALGKSGVAGTLTCDVCGHVTAIMRGDS